MENGAGIAHRFTTDTPKAPPLPTYIEVEEGGNKVKVYDPVRKACLYSEQWSRMWTRWKHQGEEVINNIVGILDEVNASDLPPITAEDVRRAIGMLSKNTALGIDLWDVKWLRSADDEMIKELTELLNFIEMVGTWPEQIMMNIIVLMGKPGGGVRPIALMPMLYRVWTKCRKGVIQEWDKLHQGPWDAAVQGSSALRAAVLSAFHDELHLLDGKEIAAILWDMEKFYDNINITKLIRKAQEMGYPVVALALGLSMHMAPRVVKAFEHYVMCDVPLNGIIAGCTQSTFFARLFLYAVLKEHSNRPGANIRSFLDDISQRVRGNTTAEVETTIVEQGNALAIDLVGIGCKISSKTTVLANTKQSRETIVRGLRARHVEVTSATSAKDLGVGTTIGYSRCTRYVRQRILKARGRVKRIQALTKANRKASKLYTTGAHPQATYGKEAMGMAPGAIQELRAMASASVNSGGSMGKCATTLIHVGLGPRMDPYHRVVLDQITMWFYLISTLGDMGRLHRMWWKAKSRILDAEGVKWGSIRGPMGATIGTLVELGWKPESPARWIDHRGNRWEYSGRGSLGPLYAAIGEAVEIKVWSKAKEHHAGAGLEVGFDMMPVKKMEKIMLKKDENPGRLYAILSGGIWTESRKFAAGLVSSPACPHCGAECQDDFHLFWGCDTVWRSQDREIAKGDFLFGEADRGQVSDACFWLRGLVPKAWTHREETDHYEVEEIPGSDFRQYAPDTPVYLDGTGGPFGTDYRIRVCGWAWIQPVIELEGGIIATSSYCGRRGTIPGRQTVPRAETYALLQFLRFAQDSILIGVVTVYTDNKGVYDRWHRGPKTCHDGNGALWDVIWDSYRTIQSRGGEIQLRKVVSHAVEKGIDQDPILTHGNGLADKHAWDGCKDRQASNILQESVEYYDMRSHIVMRRMLAIVSKYIKGREHQGPIEGPKLPSPLDQKIIDLGHQVVNKGRAGFLCTLCGDTWTKNTRHAFIANGECRGEYPWEIPESTLHKWKLPPVEKGITYRGKVVHPTHSVYFYRGVVYCNRCGYITTGGRIQHLGVPCRMRLLESQRRVLKGMREGKAPGGKPWPMPDDDQCPSGLIPFRKGEEYADPDSFIFLPGKGPTGSMLL